MKSLLPGLVLALGLAAPLCAPLNTLSTHAETSLFERTNLVAWCIVPFDAKKRGPEERAAMLERLGLRRLAYDYRAEHIPTFDAEIAALRKHKIELTAWWFPTTLNAEARGILEVLERNRVQPQLWVMGHGAPDHAASQQQRVEAEADRLRPIALAAAKIGCQVGLYNHGGWFGEPTNQIAIIRQLALPNVGIVYNLHHAHDQIERFPELLRAMRPHLLALNLNGMIREGDRHGQKIVPVGQGDADLALLKTIQESGWRGPVGILNHTEEDAEARLLDNLEGLRWALARLGGDHSTPAPKPRTWRPPAGGKERD